MASQPEETPLLKLLAQMTAASLDATSLDDEQLKSRYLTQLLL